MRARTVIIIAVLCLLLSACGPTEVQRRACDFYVEAGGDADSSIEDQRRYYTEERVAAFTEQQKKSIGTTPEAAAQTMHEYRKGKNAKALAAVAARLGLSLREVDDALARCLKSAIAASDARQQR